MNDWSLVKFDKNKKVIVIGMAYQILSPAFIDENYVYYERVGVHNANAILFIDVNDAGRHYCKAIIKRPSKYLTNLILRIHDCPALRKELGVELDKEPTSPRGGEERMGENVTDKNIKDVAGGSHSLTPAESTVGKQSPPKTAAREEGADINTLLETIKDLTDGIYTDFMNGQVDMSILSRLEELTRVSRKLRVIIRKELRVELRKSLRTQLNDINKKLLTGGISYDEVQKLWALRNEIMNELRSLRRR